MSEIHATDISSNSSSGPTLRSSTSASQAGTSTRRPVSAASQRARGNQERHNQMGTTTIQNRLAPR